MISGYRWRSNAKVMRVKSRIETCLELYSCSCLYTESHHSDPLTNDALRPLPLLHMLCPPDKQPLINQTTLPTSHHTRLCRMAYMQCWCYLRKDAAEPLCALAHTLSSLNECGITKLRRKKRQHVQVVGALGSRRAEVREHTTKDGLDCQALDLGVSAVTAGLGLALFKRPTSEQHTRHPLREAQRHMAVKSAAPAQHRHSSHTRCQS